MLQICTSSDQTLEQFLEISSFTTSSISCLSTLLVLITYYILPNLRQHWTMRFIGYLIIANFLYSLSMLTSGIFLLNQYDNSILNEIVGIYLIPTFSISSILWASVFGLKLYFVVVQHRLHSKEDEIIALLTGFGLPNILTIIWMSFKWPQTYLDSEGNEDFIEYKVFYCYVPSAIILIISVLSYIRIIIASKMIFPEESHLFLKQIAPYPIAIWIIVITLYMQFFTEEDNSCKGMIISLVSTNIRNMQGFIDAMIYGFNPIMRNELKKYFEKKNNLNSDQLNYSMPVV